MYLIAKKEERHVVTRHVIIR